MSKLGAFYTAYKEGEALEKSIETHYQFYPDMSCYVVSQGDNYSYLEKRFPNLKAVTVEDVTSWTVKNVNRNNFKNLEVQAGIKKCINEFNSWLEAAVDFCKSDYILISQPDVILRGELTIPDKVDFLQPCDINFYHPPDGCDDINKILKSIAGAKEFTCWGFPEIFSSESFSKTMLFIKNNPEIFEEIVRADDRVHHSDFNLPIFFAAAGYHSTHNP